MTIKDKVSAILRLDGWTQMRIGQELSVSQSTVNRWLRGAQPEGHHRDAVNELFTSLFSSGAQEAQIPLKGYIGTGQTIYAVEGGPEYVKAPPEGSENVVAAKVRGESMLPMLRDGWVVYWSKLLPPSELVNTLAVCQAMDGRIMVKTIHHGSKAGFWDLVSLNADVMRDVELEWAAPIDWIRPSY
ncbi:MAG TPA: S24 family peptidase [Nitrospira sp.]|nr:S24 family peptidase [Nitrospira sp.]